MKGTSLCSTQGDNLVVEMGSLNVFIFHLVNTRSVYRNCYFTFLLHTRFFLIKKKVKSEYVTLFRKIKRFKIHVSGR